MSFPSAPPLSPVTTAEAPQASDHAYPQATTQATTQATPPPLVDATLCDNLAYAQQALAPCVEENPYAANRYDNIADRFEIRADFRQYLQLFRTTTAVFILDDSGSMAMQCDTGGTRWDELKRTIKHVIELYAVDHPEGATLYFLNRPRAEHVCTTQQVDHLFASAPKGGTELTRTLMQVLMDYASVEGRLLIYIATDGEPTDHRGMVDVRSFELAIGRTVANTSRYVTILACTDDDNAVGYMNQWDRCYPRVDVCDDYRSERAEILRVQGASYPFSFGDYAVKTTFGAIVPALDKLDEVRMPRMPTLHFDANSDLQRSVYTTAPAVQQQQPAPMPCTPPRYAPTPAPVICSYTSTPQQQQQQQQATKNADDDECRCCSLV
jgi:hypothetical protein